MKTPSLVIPVYCCLLLLGACHSNPSATSTQHSGGDSSRIDSLGPATRSHFRDVQAFLDFIKRPNSDNNVGGDEWNKNFRIGNIDSFLSFITVDSLEIDDADADPGKDSLKYSRRMLRQQLTNSDL